MDTTWHVESKHGSFELHSRGGMLGNVTFKSGDRSIKPFYEAPWIGASDTFEPPLLNHLRSEFPCVPFGVPHAAESATAPWRSSLAGGTADREGKLDPSDDILHGYSSISNWELIGQEDGEIQIGITYPETSPIRRLTRTLRADPDRPAIDFTLTIESREQARRPVGLHPNLALPAVNGAVRLKPGRFLFGVVHPAGPERGVSRAEPGAFFENLERVPTIGGERESFARLPFAHDTEEILQLCGTDGTITLVCEAAGVRYRLSWDSSILPSLLLWISNRGRSYAPWNSRNLCLGVEPLAAAFDLGSPAALAQNPINEKGVPTAVKLTPGAPTTIRYCFEVLDL
ncbi:hypothetical protein ACWAT4_07280 [Bradyrhizobium manausense]